MTAACRRPEMHIDGDCERCEVDALRTVVRLLVDRYWDDTPMGRNVVDLPDVRWRILPPHTAAAVRRALAPPLGDPPPTTQERKLTTRTIAFRPPLAWTVAFVLALSAAFWFLDPFAVVIGWLIGHLYCAAGTVLPLLREPKQ